MQVLSQQVWVRAREKLSGDIRAALDRRGSKASSFMAKTCWWIMKPTEWLVISVSKKTRQDGRVS